MDRGDDEDEETNANAKKWKRKRGMETGNEDEGDDEGTRRRRIRGRRRKGKRKWRRGREGRETYPHVYVSRVASCGREWDCDEREGAAVRRSQQDGTRRRARTRRREETNKQNGTRDGSGNANDARQGEHDGANANRRDERRKGEANESE